MDTKSVTIVTGAGRGIGKAIALRMSKETPVVLVGPTQKNLAEVCNQITTGGLHATFQVGDVRVEQTAKSTLEAIENYGLLGSSLKVKNLILNAGISKAGAFEKFPELSFRELFEVNVMGAFHFLKAFLPKMEEGSTIILLAGSAGIKGYSSMAGYCATKHALVGLARGLAVELRKKGILVFPVCPGPVDTDMTAPIIDMMMKKGMTKEAASASLGAANKHGRLNTPDEVAELVATLCLKPNVMGNGEPVTL